MPSMKPKDRYALSWPDFCPTITSAFQDIRNHAEHFDVTLAVEDGEIRAHKLVLCACSDFFRKLFLRHLHQQHPLIYVTRANLKSLQAVLDFMYIGEVQVGPQDLESFLNLAEELQVKGLTPPASTSESEDSRGGQASKIRMERSDSKTTVRAEKEETASTGGLETVPSALPLAAASAAVPVTSVTAVPSSSSDSKTPSAARPVPRCVEENRLSKIVNNKRRNPSFPTIVGAASLGSPPPKVARHGASAVRAVEGRNSPVLSTSEVVALGLLGNINAAEAARRNSRMFPEAPTGIARESITNEEVEIDDAEEEEVGGIKKRAFKDDISITDNMEAVTRSLGSSLPIVEDKSILGSLNRELSELTRDFVVEAANNGGWRCVSCKKLFSAKEDCEHHVEGRHVQSKGGFCPVCFQRFLSIKAVKDHVVNAHKEKMEEKEVDDNSDSSDNLDVIEIFNL